MSTVERPLDTLATDTGNHNTQVGVILGPTCVTLLIYRRRFRSSIRLRNARRYYAAKPLLKRMRGIQDDDMAVANEVQDLALIPDTNDDVSNNIEAVETYHDENRAVKAPRIEIEEDIDDVVFPMQFKRKYTTIEGNNAIQSKSKPRTNDTFKRAQTRLQVNRVREHAKKELLYYLQLKDYRPNTDPDSIDYPENIAERHKAEFFRKHNNDTRLNYVDLEGNDVNPTWGQVRKLGLEKYMKMSELHYKSLVRNSLNQQKMTDEAWRRKRNLENYATSAQFFQQVGPVDTDVLADIIKELS